MNWQPNKTALIRTCLASLLCLSPVMSSIFVQAQEASGGRQIQAVVPPVGENPGRRESAGIRGNCLPKDASLTAIVPEQQVTLTASVYPSLFFYVPKTASQEAIFILYDENDREIYKSIFEVAETSGVIKVSIPDFFTSPRLEMGKNYFWQFALLCSNDEPSTYPLVEGWLQRVPLNADILAELESASEYQQVDLYADAGIWQEALTTLANLRQQEPDNLSLENQWNELLNNIGLSKIAQEPMI